MYQKRRYKNLIYASKEYIKHKPPPPDFGSGMYPPMNNTTININPINITQLWNSFNKQTELLYQVITIRKTASLQRAKHHAHSWVTVTCHTCQTSIQRASNSPLFLYSIVCEIQHPQAWEGSEIGGAKSSILIPPFWLRKSTNHHPLNLATMT